MYLPSKQRQASGLSPTETDPSQHDPEAVELIVTSGLIPENVNGENTSTVVWVGVEWATLLDVEARFDGTT